MKDDDFQKKAFELWMAVTMFISTYQNEKGAVVRCVEEMLPYATDLQNFWSAYQVAASNALIRKLHTKIRSRVKLMQDKLDESMQACGSNQAMLDKYSENQNYIGRKLNELHGMVPKEPRTVAEPEQVELDFGMHEEKARPEPDEKFDSGEGMFQKRLNALRTAIDGFVSSYGDGDRENSIVGYVAGMSASAKIADSLWRRIGREGVDSAVYGQLLDSLRKYVASMKDECGMVALVMKAAGEFEKYEQNYAYVVKKLDSLEKALP